MNHPRHAGASLITHELTADEQRGGKKITDKKTEEETKTVVYEEKYMAKMVEGECYPKSKAPYHH